MYRYVSAITVLVFLAGCAKTPEQKIEDNLRAAGDYLERYEFESAQKAYDRVAEAARGIPYDRLGKALIFEQQLYYYDALNEFLEMTVQDPDFAPGYAGVYRGFSHLEHPERAALAAARYYELEPENPDAAFARVHSLFEVNQPVQAEAAAMKAEFEGLDEASVKLLLSRARFNMYEFDSAYALLGAAMEKPLSSSRLHFEAAEALLSAGEIDSAMIHSRLGAELPSATVYDLYEHFYRAVENGYYADARKVLDLLKARGAAEGVILTLKLQIAKKKKSFTVSRVLSSDILEVTPRNVSTVMIDLTSATGQFTDPRMLENLRGVVQSYMNQSNYNQELRKFINLRIDLQRVDTEDRVAAWSAFEKIQGPLANLKKVQLSKAYLTYRVGRFDEALNYLKQMRDSHIHYADWLTEIADIYAHPSIRKYKLAEESYQTALKRNKWYRQALIKYVEMLLGLKRYDEALKLFEEYPHLEERYSDVALLKGICLAEKNDFDAALNIFEKRGRNQRGDLSLFLDLLKVLERKYRSREVVRLAEICASWANENTDILVFAARLLSDNKSFARAQELISKALSVEPDFSEAQIQQARADYALGNREQAFAVFEKILEEEPHNGDANYYFSRILAEENLDPQRASNLARSAILVFYDEIKAAMNLFEVYYMLGQYRFAYGEADKIRNRHPDSPIIWYNLGRASQKLEGDSTEVFLNKAIELGLGGDDLKTANGILAGLQD